VRRSRAFFVVAALWIAVAGCARGIGTAATEVPIGAQTPTEATEAAEEDGSELPATPDDYATAAFDAWRRGDQEALAQLAKPAVASVLASRAPESPDGWEGPQCEGAAGSTYCTWVRPETQLTIRIANEAASQGQSQAVSGATFAAPPGAVAIWPYTTAEEAQNSQEQVDEGHSPWQLSPEAVALAYADAVLGWHTANAEPTQGSDTRFTVTDTDPEGGGVVELELVQPVRPGEGGIWAIIRVDAIDQSGV
jgi:hypothetical protein